VSKRREKVVPRQANNITNQQQRGFPNQRAIQGKGDGDKEEIEDRKHDG
jgi:hypothetical protein